MPQHGSLAVLQTHGADVLMAEPDAWIPGIWRGIRRRTSVSTSASLGREPLQTLLVERRLVRGLQLRPRRFSYELHDEYDSSVIVF